MDMADDKLEGDLGPIKVSIRGAQAIIIFLLALSLCVLVWAGFEILEIAQVHEIHNSDEHQEITEGMEALIYINSLSQVEKEKLNLMKPQMIREMEYPNPKMPE